MPAFRDVLGWLFAWSIDPSEYFRRHPCRMTAADFGLVPTGLFFDHLIIDGVMDGHETEKIADMLIRRSITGRRVEFDFVWRGGGLFGAMELSRLFSSEIRIGIHFERPGHRFVLYLLHESFYHPDKHVVVTVHGGVPILEPAPQILVNELVYV